MGKPPVELSVDQEALKKIGAVLKEAADGKKLAREFTKSLRTVLEPAKQDVRAKLMGMPIGGSDAASPGLRSQVAARLQVQARLSGRTPGAALRARKTPGVRNFKNAPKRLNQKKGWRRRVFGGAWVKQVGEPRYFDDPIEKRQSEYQRAARQVMLDMWNRVRRKAG